MLEPSGPWRLDAGETKCRLARLLGEGPAEHLLFIELDEPTAAVDFAIAGGALKEIDWDEPAEFKFGSLEPMVEKQYSKGSLGDYGTALLTIATSLSPPREKVEKSEGDMFVENATGLAGIPAERFAGNEVLGVMQGERTIVSLKLDNLVPALTALNKCAEGFIEHWGLDLAQHRTMQRGPKWINWKQIIRRIGADYPSAALRRGEQGSIRFVVLVDEEGQFMECRQSDATELNRLTSSACREMERAQFEPAIDAEGKAMRSYFVTKVKYVLP